MLAELTKELAAARSLSVGQIQAAVEDLTKESVSTAAKADFLCHLALKGETVEEIAAFAGALREKSVEPPIDSKTRASGILDVCGTGGDGLRTFNISTAVAIICAAAGVPVAKHGNRAITSQAGSADVLEAMAVRIDLPPAEAAQTLRDRNFAFFFAPNYHPAFKHIAPARKLCAERGQRTIFNFLGPLLNPARPSVQLVGVPRPDLCEPLARVLQSLGVRRGMVVCGSLPGEDKAPRHLDELSPAGPTTIAEFYQERGFSVSQLELQTDLLPIQPTTLADLCGGDRETNATIIQSILSGEERGPKRDAVLLNAAAALLVADRVRSLDEGWNRASEVIESRLALQKLTELKEADC